MQFLVDAGALAFTVAGAPEPLQRHESGLAPAREGGEDAEPWRVPLLVAGADFGDVMLVTVAGDPGLEAGTPVCVEGLTLLTWKRARGWGYSLRAGEITARSAPSPRERP